LRDDTRCKSLHLGHDIQRLPCLPATHLRAGSFDHQSLPCGYGAVVQSLGSLLALASQLRDASTAVPDLCRWEMRCGLRIRLRAVLHP
jgi:hypothetical protein